METIVPTTTAGWATHVLRQATATVTSSPATTTAVDFITTNYITVPGVTNDHVTLAGQTISIAIPTCIQTIVPDANGYVPPGTCGALWDYYPSFAAAVAFTIMFGILTGVHIFQASFYKKKFCWVIIMASIWETCSYLFRSISTRFQQSSGIYLVFQVFVLLAPLWVNAFGYLLLSRMVYYFVPSRRIFSIPAATLAFGFVFLDLVAFGIQLAGGSMSGPTSPPEDQLRAIHIYMAGIGLQEFFILGFLVLAIKFHFMMGRPEVMAYHSEHAKPNWRWLLWALYGSLALISTRIIYRLIEFSAGAGTSNPLLTNETYFYVLEASPMFLATMAFNVVHPGTVLVGPDAEMPGFKETIKGFFRRKPTAKDIEMRSYEEDLEYVPLQP